VADAIIRSNLVASARVLVTMASVSELDAMKVLSKYPELVSEYLSAENYSADQLRSVFSSDVISEEDTLRVFDHCIVRLEGFLDSLESLEEIQRCIQFVSVLCDGKFLKWYLSTSASTGPGQRIARLGAVVNRYRRTLVSRQQTRMKTSEDSCISAVLAKNSTPLFNGRVFYHHLNI
jgi:hypothetical protein